MFSKVDLLWGYLRLELAEDWRYLTSFVTHEGVYRFCSLFFGLASGPSAFHQVVRKILDGLEGFLSILDDILMYGCTVAEQMSVCVGAGTVAEVQRYGASSAYR